MLGKYLDESFKFPALLLQLNVGDGTLFVKIYSKKEHEFKKIMFFFYL